MNSEGRAFLVSCNDVLTKHIYFFNRRYSLLSFGRPQLYNSEALPFTYGQYVVIELADKISVIDCFCTSRKNVFHIGLMGEPIVD